MDYNVFWATPVALTQSRSKIHPLYKIEPLSLEDVPLSELPAIQHIIIANNDELTIRNKIANAALARYPLELLETVILCNGSSDNTVAIAREQVEYLKATHMNVTLDVRLAEENQITLIEKQIGESQADVVLLSEPHSILPGDVFLKLAAVHKDSYDDLPKP